MAIKPSTRSGEEAEEAGGQESKHLGDASKKVLPKGIVSTALPYTTFMFIFWSFLTFVIFLSIDVFH